MTSFDTVDDFLRKTREAKQKQRPDIESLVEETFEDPHIIAITPDLGEQILRLTEKYGDETLRQIALFALGKWFAYHTAYVEELVDTDQTREALNATVDATRVGHCITTLETVGSFSGSDEWIAMVKELAIGTVCDEYNRREDQEETDWGRSADE
ncbi:MAG: hypothetical protein CML73_03020 [Rhodobiaceae bacterium]|nr:hypothetical protein [Rhodobiaceae bacterium]